MSVTACGPRQRPGGLVTLGQVDHGTLPRPRHRHEASEPGQLEIAAGSRHLHAPGVQRRRPTYDPATHRDRGRRRGRPPSTFGPLGDKLVSTRRSGERHGLLERPGDLHRRGRLHRPGRRGQPHRRAGAGDTRSPPSTRPASDTSNAPSAESTQSFAISKLARPPSPSTARPPAPSATVHDMTASGGSGTGTVTWEAGRGL